ncbi:hypothetical protein ACQZ48_19945 [Agrobacterium sp. 22-209-1]
MSKFVIDKTDCLDSAARNLNDLLDVICALQFDTADGPVDRRIDSLLWIARDMSEGIVCRMGDRSDSTPEPVKPVAEYLNGLVAHAISEVQLKADIEELHDKSKALIASFGTAEKSKGEANE